MPTANNPDRWLTAKRLRAHATILAVCLWSFYAWNLSTPGLRDRNGNLKGTDFLHFYTLGSLAGAHRGSDLYDMNAQAALAAQRVPEAAGIRYLPLYPPQVSLFFAPLANFSYGWALSLWWVFNAVLYSACGYTIWRACPRLRNHGGTVALLAAAFPAFFNLIAWGQTSGLALACFTGMFFLLRDRRDFLAGLLLGCLIFKPQLGLAAAIVFVAIGAWKIILGAILSAVVQLSAGILDYGMEPLQQWARLLLNLRSVMSALEPKPYQTHSLRTFWSMLIPWPNLAFGLYVLTALAVLAMMITLWRNCAPMSLRFSALLLTTVLVAPHLTVYDLVILAPAFLLLSDWLLALDGTLARYGLGSLLYSCYALPLLGPITRWTHVQLSVVAMVATLLMLWRFQLLNKNASASGNRLAQADS
jgi:alpha-1,2-mannosyltransferase